MALYRIEGEKLLAIDPISKPEEFLYQLLMSRPEAILPDEDDKIIILGYKIPCEGFEIDLLGIDNSGNLVIVEVKGAWRSQREVVSQLLEYGSNVEEWGLEELKNVLVKKGIISPSNDLLSWLKTRFSEQYGEEPSFNEQNINANQRLVLFLPLRDPRVEKIVKYLRKRGLDIYYTAYNLYKDGETIYLVTNEVVGSETSPQKKLQAKEAISVEEYIEIFQKYGLNNTAEVIKQLYEEGRAYSRKQLKLSIAEGKISIYFDNPDTYPHMLLYVNTSDIIDKLVEIAERLNIPLKRDKLRPGLAPITLIGIEKLKQFDKSIKQLIHQLENKLP